MVEAALCQIKKHFKEMETEKVTHLDQINQLTDQIQQLEKSKEETEKPELSLVEQLRAERALANSKLL